MFLALALAAKGSADASPALWGGSLLLLWASAACLPAEGSRPPTALAIGVVVFAIWIVAGNLFLHPYSAAAQFHAAFLVGGYWYGRRARASVGAVYATALAFAVLLAIWAVWQFALGTHHRPRGPFVTPGALGATVNLLLLPGLVLFVTGSRRFLLAVMLGVLGVALIVSTSRGAWLGAAGATVAALLLLRRARLPIAPGTHTIVAGLLVVLVLAGLWNLATFRDFATGADATASFGSRLELYRLVWTALPSSWLLGAGYDAFYYLLETGRASVPSYGNTTTYFVHNDYLQSLHAFGAPGLAGMLFIVAAPLVAVWRRAPDLEPFDRRLAVAGATALLSMAIHALVDFPFFVPGCLLLYGAALGMLDAALHPRAPCPVLAAPAGWKRASRAAALTLVAWILAVPVAAEAAGAYAEKQWRNGDAQRAAYWFEAARRIDSRDWRFHWHAAQFWFAYAAAHSDPAAALRADVAFAAAISANGREVRPLHGRIDLHTRLRKVLAEPADGATLRAWTERAMTLAPTDPAARAARERVLRQFPR